MGEALARFAPGELAIELNPGREVRMPSLSAVQVICRLDPVSIISGTAGLLLTGVRA
jgi:hypothetical protein